jgi:hypothetical protein
LKKGGGGFMSAPKQDLLDEIEENPIIDLCVIMQAMCSNRTEAKHMPILAEALMESFYKASAEPAV